MFSWMTDSVTRIRPGTKTERGSVIPDWSTAASESVSNCSMQPAGTSLDQDGRVLGLTDGYTLYAPADADITAGDRISYGGSIYAIDGDIRTWSSPAGSVAHLVINLKRWAG